MRMLLSEPPKGTPGDLQCARGHVVSESCEEPSLQSVAETARLRTHEENAPATSNFGAYEVLFRYSCWKSTKNFYFPS